IRGLGMLRLAEFFQGMPHAHTFVILHPDYFRLRLVYNRTTNRWGSLGLKLAKKCLSLLIQPRLYTDLSYSFSFAIFLLFFLFSFLVADSLHQHWNTGTTNMVMDWISMPPKVGMAIGTMISAPLPVEVRTGSKAISAVAVVIAAGLTRFKPAYMTASRISSFVLGFRASNVSWMYVPINTPSLVASPNRAIKHTQTAMLRLMLCIWNRSRIFVPPTVMSINQGCPYTHNKMKPPASATKTPEKWINEAVIVLN